MGRKTQKKQRLFPAKGAVLLFTVVLLGMPVACSKPGAGNERVTSTPTTAPEPTKVPEQKEPEATEEPKATKAPKATATPRPTATPKPTPTPEPIPENNLVKNATFDGDTSGWGIYTQSGGEGTLSAENGKLALQVSSLGTVNYAVQIYPEENITLEQGCEYRVRYEISSTENRSIEVMIQQNGGSYQSYTWKKVELKSVPQQVDYTFTMAGATDTNTRLAFNCGTQGDALGTHTIYVDNVVVAPVKATDVSEEETGGAPEIRLNQVGYRPKSQKVAVFCDVADGTGFSVVNAETDAAVYTGEVYGEKMNTAAKEKNSFGDFSAVTEAGTYYIACGDVKSHEFEIGTTVYDTLLADMVRMFYLQRCGQDVEDEVFGHVACHTGMAKVYGTEQYIDVSGGWHDAGDYGRYVVPAAKSVADLLYAYDTVADGTYIDNIGIPESCNGISDVLDEVRYELEWMLKMQAENGGVYHKVSCANFCGYIMPEKETGQLIVTPISTTATADFCASMAMAYEFYKQIDPKFSERCLTAAERAWAFLEANPDLIFQNPPDISTGAYNDGSDKDERYWAVAQMYRATGDKKYLEALEKMAVKTGLDWSNVGDYGNIALVTMEDIDKNSDVYIKARDAILRQADGFAKTTKYNAYGVAISAFYWGSNMTVSNAGIILGLAYELTGDEMYLAAAESNLHYLLGTNPLATCFVSGYGTVSPQNPHHRPSIVKKQAMVGMLAGGVNSNLEDPAAKSKLKDAPLAKRYIDHLESYSTNEITIYWNSPFIYLLSLTMEE